MINKNSLWLTWMLLLPVVLYGQEERKWALGYTGGVLIDPVLTDNPSGVSNGRGSRSFKMTGEYCFPEKWSLQAGYFRLEMNYGDALRTMEGLQLGVKKYFVNQDFFLQPYVQAGAQFNWGRRIEYTDFEYGGYKEFQKTRNPRLSFVPGVGVDLFLFSSVALVAEYGFNIGVDSKTDIEIQQAGLPPYRMKDRGMYHQLELGIRITFPFQFTDEDGQNFVILLTQLYYDWLNDR